MFKKKSILDVFTQISSDREASKPDLCLRLWNHLNKPPENVPDKVPEEGEADEAESESISKEVTYTLGRLIQGLGSPRAHIRKCYFSTLVALLSNCNDTFGPITLAFFKSLVEKHLSKFESKGEKGEVLTGRILAYGVTFRSKIFLNSSLELQQSMITEMLTKCKERSYLPLLTYSFLVDFLHNIDETTFKTVVWPVLSKEILVNWPSQRLETLYCLLEVHKKYPQLLKRKLILSALHSHSILHEETIENVINMLTNFTLEERLKHPLYGTIGAILAQEENYELMLKFWIGVETVLHNSPTRLQQLAVLKIFSCLVQNLPVEKISNLLTLNFVDHLINSCKLTVGKPDKLCSTSKTTLQLVVSRTIEKSEESTSTSVYKLLCKLLFESGHILIDKITGLKIVFPCIAKLNAKHVRLVAKKCENVILNEKQKNVNVRWTFKDRCYATQLLARLISHPQSQDMDWKIKHLKFMLKYSLFSTTTEEGGYVSNELATVLKNSFFTALSHQLSHLENHRMVLISLVYYIDNMLKTGEIELKIPISDEASECWNNTMAKIQKIDLKINETAERKTVMYVFQTLFLQMALHIFVDATVARDILKELNRCYKKEKNQFEAMKNKKNDRSVDANDLEPKWIDIAVELFLSLLSRDTFLLRQLISRIFPHFCPYLTAQVSSQILEVLNPASRNNILIDENEESDVEESDIDDEDENENMEIDEDESDSNIEDDEDIEENAIEKTRRAIRDALGIAGTFTDTESIDLDDMDDEEGKRLDLALSEAFKSTHQKSQNKNKKQSASDRALTNFRIRVMDLVDIYINNDPCLALVLDTIPILFALLEFCIRNSHQKPLETRIRSTLKKIGNLKKCSKVDEVEESNVVDILKNLMHKGDRSAPIFLDLSFNISQCCAFLVKMGIQVSRNKKENKTSDPVFDVIATATEDFFLRRDCLLPLNLFENILLKVSWTKNVNLCERIVSYAFNPAVRGFRRNQALTLMACFYKNTRLLSILKETTNEDYVSLEDKILSRTINLLNSLKSEKTQKLKPSFVSELFSLLYAIKSTKFCAEAQKWKNLAQLLQSFLNNGSFGLNVSRKYFTKLCSLLKVSVTQKQNDSRKRKRKECDERGENSKQSRVVKNGFINNCNHIEDNIDSDGSENAESSKKMKNANEVSKTVIKKKKSKRKTKEHFDSKKLRNETLANDVEVFNFSKNTIMEPDLLI